jgi:hypothetical protein
MKGGVESSLTLHECGRSGDLLKNLDLTPLLSAPYKFRDVSYGYDANGTFTGRGEITATATLDADADSMNIVSKIDVYDAQGNPVFSFCGRASGTRC